MDKSYGGGVRIAVTPFGNPWVVNDSEPSTRVNGAWTKKPGSPDIAIGPNGAVWVVGTIAAPGGFGVYYWRDSTSRGLPGLRALVVSHCRPRRVPVCGQRHEGARWLRELWQIVGALCLA